MVRIISALILAVSASFVSAAEPIGLVDNPPDRHIVVRGDTLWGISGKFLKQPWRWPEIWGMNKAEIKNPHLIYPGDVIVLDMSSGNPRLKLAKSYNSKLQPKVYSEAVQDVIPSIPSNIIEPFISQPLIIEAGEHEKLPRIVATQENRVMVGGGDSVYASGITGVDVEKWNVFREGKALKDPDTGEILGYEAVFLGGARLVRPGEPSSLNVTQAKQEIGRGDRLLPAPPPNIVAYVPHRPDVPVQGKVLSIYGGVNEGGPGYVISLNRGKADGLEIGNVVALYRKRISTSVDEDGKRTDTVVPEERYALAFVFRTFDRIAYALVVEASRPVIIGDAARNP